MFLLASKNKNLAVLFQKTLDQDSITLQID
jgi:hypothetical protein